jgi:hypothetical protein
MKRLVVVLVLFLGCSKKAPEPETLAFQSLGAFDYTEKMKLPVDVAGWNGKYVKATGFINPLSQTRNITSFLLVKDRASCCYGKMPQMNHYISIKLKPGETTNYSTDPVTVRGVIQIEERFDGDWPLGLYWMDGAEVIK